MRYTTYISLACSIKLKGIHFINQQQNTSLVMMDGTTFFVVLAAYCGFVILICMWSCICTWQYSRLIYRLRHRIEAPDAEIPMNSL